MNVNNNTTSAIADSLFRLVRDGSALRGPFGARHRGAVGATGKLTALYAFGSLSRALVCCVPIGLRGAMHLEQVCCVWHSRASETKHETYSVT